MNLALILQEIARQRPEAPAILDVRWRRDRVTTFAQLEQAADRGATLLAKLGLRPGDPVLVFQPMSAELYVILLALFRLGLVAVALDPSAGREHVERCCALYPPRALIASPRAHLLRLCCPALRRIPIKISVTWPVPGAVRWANLARFPRHGGIETCSPGTPALVTFTSGSTGQPKGAIRTHGFLQAQHEALKKSLHLTPGDVDLATLPIFALTNLGSGVTSVIPDADLRYPGEVNPGPIVEQMRRLGVTSSVASPAFFERLARHCREKGLTLPALRKLFTGGAPVFPRLMEQMQRLAPHAQVVAVYGSTEAEPIAHVAYSQWQPEDFQAANSGRGLLAGHPVPEVRLRIIPDQWGKPLGPFTPAEFDALQQAAGQAGEIVVSGDHVLKGYLRGLGDEETKFRVAGEVWHRTGDAGYLDGAGRLWLLGRCVARIRDDHGELYPFAAETAVYGFAEVKRAALVAHRGRRIMAIEFFPGTSLPLEAIRSRLASAQIEEIRVLDRVPVDSRHNAKIDYPALFRLLE